MNVHVPGQLPRAATPQVWPLTPPQRALWFLDNFNPDSSFYVIGMGLMLRGRLDEDALFDALSDCVTRHEALRTRFLTLGGRPYQVFTDGQDCDRSVTDVSGAEDPVADARRYLDEMSSAPFDLTADAPLRTRLVRLGEDHYVLLIAVHHIVFDGWSTQLLLADLGEAYRARAAGHDPQFADSGIGVGQYAARLAAQDVDGAGLDPDELGFWQDALQYTPVLDLPGDFARPAHRTFAGAVHTFDLAADIAGPVRDLARSLATTPFTLLSTAFTRLVARLSGSDDVVVGVPLAGRTNAEALGMVGFFANTLPMRVDVAGAHSFREALERHRTVHQELLNRQHIPFARLVEALKPRREANRNPYYDVCFQYLPAPDQGVDFGDLTLDFISSVRSSSQFDLSCDVHQTGDTLRVYFEYSTELFAEETIHRYAEQFAGFVRDMVAELATDDTTSAPAAAGTSAARAVDGTGRAGLPAIVAAQAARRPDHEAVRDAKHSMTFRELDVAAGRFAAVLAARGVTRGDRVAVLVPPSIPQAVAMLGIMRIGAVYVPLDTRMPADRLAGMTSAAECRLVLHDTASKDTAATLAVALLSVESALAEDRLPLGPVPYAPEDAAYIIFTSGSTGRPKGVVVPHRAAVSLSQAAAEIFRLTEADTMLSMASPAVDVSIEELFASWEGGAAVLVHGSDIADVTQLVEEQRLTTLNLPAALWHEWTRQIVAGEKHLPHGLRLVIAGSDRVDPSRVRQWHEGAGAGVQLFNAYGVTEAAVTSTWYDTAEFARDAEHTPRLPIGRALPNTVLYVLDDHGDLVPPGVPGELYIGGSGVALGYLNAPEETGARFVPDPFRGAEGHLMYRTGDRVRVLPSGALEFRGRLDNQVKIRGTRIELAEVERVAGETPGVAGFVADVRSDPQGTPRLVGYVRTARDESGGSLDQTRVDEWKQVHDADMFNEVEGGQRADLNASGWLSSYDLQPIAAAHMEEWRDQTVARIRAQRPGRVLEIGCGTGMILLSVAPHAEDYVGTDISPRALSYVMSQLPAAGLDDGRVRLVEAPAHDLSAIASEQFDLVVLNSVVQYFPTAQYLDDVLTQAWRLVRPGGRLMIGDVRDLSLLRAFHLSVQQFRNPAADDLRTVLDNVDEAVENENELCLAPGYFHALADGLPELVDVDIRAKSGRARTEMNGFRYDVVLHRAACAEPEPGRLTQPQQIDGTGLTLERFRDLLRETGEAGTVIHNVVDGRVATSKALHEALSDPRCASLGEGLRRAGQHPGVVHPADLEAAAAEAGLALALTAKGDGLMDVIASFPARAASLPMFRTGAVYGSSGASSTESYANRPLEAAQRRDLLNRLREHMGRHLSRTMIPSRLVFVEDFPLTVSGKVDRSRLPEPARTVARANHCAPATVGERALAAVWEEMLGIDSVGLDDNFFEIGGDSISWLRIISRCTAKGITLTTRDVFQYQTLRELAAALAERGDGNGRNDQQSGAVTVLQDEPVDAELTPVQQWFFDAFPQGRDRQTQTQWFAIDGEFSLPVVRQALRDVIARHTALGGLRFVQVGDGWHQQSAPVPLAEQLVIEEASLPTAGPERDHLIWEATERSQNGLCVTDGPLLRAVVLRTPDDEKDLLFWCIHHLVVDAVSWQFLTEDLATALDARRENRTPVLPNPGVSFLKWSRWNRQTAGAIADRERQYWQEVTDTGEYALPVRHPLGTGRYAEAHRHVRHISVPVSSARRPGNRMLATCLTALRPALAPLVGDAPAGVTLEFHGRPTGGDAPDVSRTVGWFTSLFPFVLREEPSTETTARLGRVPDGGIGYGRLRLDAGQPLTRGSDGVVVNYLGEGTANAGTGPLTVIDAPHDSAGQDVDGQAAMPFAVELGFAMAEDGTLVADLVLGDRHFDAGEAAQFADALASALRRSFGAPFALVPPTTQESPAFTTLIAGFPAEDAYPLAPMQRVMLNRHLLAGSKDANYNECVLTLRGQLDTEALRTAWRELAKRYDVLRTSVEWTSLPEPLQVVHRNPPEALTILDWTSMSPVQVQRRLNALLEEHRATPPSLCGTPPYRLVLVRISPRESRLVWTDHHILLDGWSSSLLIGELVRAYTDLVLGTQPFQGEEPPLSYGSFVRWLRDRPAGQAQDFWREQLGGFESPTPLPFDVAPPALSAHADDYAERTVVLPDDVVEALGKVARRRHTTLGTTLAAGWAALLHRNAGRGRVTFGVSLNGRPAGLGDVSTMAGLYLTTLPLTVSMDPDLTTGALLDAVAETSWRLGEVSAGESLADVYEAAGIPLSRTVFHSVLVVQNFAGPDSNGRGPEAPLHVETGHSRLLTGSPLTLAVDPGSASLRLIWDQRVFAQETAELILDQFLGILAEIAADCGRRLGDLPAPVFTPRPVSIGHAAPLPSTPTGPPPQGATERRIAVLWHEALGIAAVGREVNLFEAGANSMTVTRLHARLSEEFGLAVPLSDIFRNPTVAAQALLFGAPSPTTPGMENGEGASSAPAVVRGAQRRSALQRRTPYRQAGRTTSVAVPAAPRDTTAERTPR
ncbi:amino acid adenylation domain-containing protein [Streptomyces sp. NPDC050255]|uniref:amino acid adenylation domain-containing protein n=1 Tax=Streptomyces sp. NPDC050255 TaxID=3365606 RepID=UPI0037AD3490